MSDDVDQRVFDTVARHLLQQMAQSTCMFGAWPIPSYRGDLGRRCAIGVLIDEEHYDELLEGESLVGMGADEVMDAVCGSGYEGASFWLLVHLQKLHDDSSPKRWRDELIDLADSFRLDSSVVTEYS